MTIGVRHVMQLSLFTLLAPLYCPCLIQFFIFRIFDVVGFLSIPIHADIVIGSINPCFELCMRCVFFAGTDNRFYSSHSEGHVFSLLAVPEIKDTPWFTHTNTLIN